MTERVYMQRVTYQHTIEYEIVNCPGIFEPNNPALLSVGKLEDARRFVVVDCNVEKYYSSEIRNYFTQNQVEAKIISFPGGEEYKTIDSYLSIVHELDAFPIHRRDEPIIAIGGGVLTDVVGFVASCYRRGIPYIKVPTTLMGYVDASIGVKTSVNFNGHKNRLGGFIPPQKVLLDKSFLKTLPKRHILNGMGEIIKMAIIKDAGLFSQLETHGARSVEFKFQDEASDAILERSISGMIDELQHNLLEEDLARKVDFGHTFSYGLEMRHDSDLFHGEAVLLDIALSTVIARERSILSPEETDRIFRLIHSLGMNLDTSILEPNLLWQSLQERIYHRNGLQRVPLPRGIGNCVFVNDIGLDEILSAIKLLENLIAIKNGVF